MTNPALELVLNGSDYHLFTVCFNPMMHSMDPDMGPVKSTDRYIDNKLIAEQPGPCVTAAGVDGDESGWRRIRRVRFQG